jgi:hypothetical protein
MLLQHISMHLQIGSVFMKRLTPVLVILAILCGTVVAPRLATAQERPYTEGTVWSLTLIRVKPGMLNIYLRDLGANRKEFVENARQQGLILSSRILYGDSSNRDDWDLVILDEYKNWAALDGLSEKLEALAAKLVGPEDTRAKIMVKRTEVREILGAKTMQELLLK